jgi:hypothetical protein
MGKKKAGLMTGRTIRRFFEGSLNLAAGGFEGFKSKRLVTGHAAECGRKEAALQ